MGASRTGRDDIAYAFAALQVDRAWYEAYWMTGEPRSVRHRFVGLVALAGVLIAVLAGL
jgi:hypothetical protein